MERSDSTKPTDDDKIWLADQWVVTKFQDQIYRRRNADQWEDFKCFIDEHVNHGTITQTTNWSQVEILWNNEHFRSFERLGGSDFNNKKYPQAAFWFFQHRMHKLGGVEYINVGLSVQSAGYEWKGFGNFLAQKHENGDINVSTTWADVENLWPTWKNLWNNEHFRSFERLGDSTSDNKKYPQAAFWFFQHRMHRLGGNEYCMVRLSVQSAGDEWKGFDYFLAQKHENGDINLSTTWGDVENLWLCYKEHFRSFERLGGSNFDNKKYPQAAFWFFQHRMHRLGGAEYINVRLSVQLAGDKWKGFDNFLVQKHNNDDINLNTTWADVEHLWPTSSTCG